MNETDIRKYAGLMKELGLTGLEINEESKIVRLERNVTLQQSNTVLTEACSENSAEDREESDYISIKSPRVRM